MRSDPVIGVVCDVCGLVEQEIGLCATAKGWDERTVDGDLVRDGWRVTGGQDVCPECVERERIEGRTA